MGTGQWVDKSSSPNSIGDDYVALLLRERSYNRTMALLTLLANPKSLSAKKLFTNFWQIKKKEHITCIGAGLDTEMITESFLLKPEMLIKISMLSLLICSSA